MKALLPLISFVLMTCSTRAALYTNAASADSFVRAAAPAVNYGGAGSLAVSGANAVNGSGVANGSFDSFIRFDSAAMVTNFDAAFGSNNWTINAAKLRITEIGAPGNAIFNRGKGGFEIRWIADDAWVEGTGSPSAPTATGLSYNDEPALLNSGADVSLGTFTNGGVDGSLSLPLALAAPFISDLKAGGAIGLYLTAIDPGIGFTFNSRSFGTVAARPFLELSAVPMPGIAAMGLSGTDIVLAGTNGAAGATYYVLGSTNLGLPLNQWQPIATNVLTGSGAFSITATNAASGSSPRQFVVLQVQ